MVWIIFCNENNGVVGVGPQQPKTFSTQNDALRWIEENKDQFPNCELRTKEIGDSSDISASPDVPKAISSVMETKEVPNLPGYKIYVFDFSGR